MVTLETLRREKKPEILRFAEMYGAHNVRVFGSVARGDNRDDSDIDFLVEFDNGRTLFDLVGLRLDLQELLGATVEVVTPKQPPLYPRPRGGRGASPVIYDSARFQCIPAIAASNWLSTARYASEAACPHRRAGVPRGSSRHPLA